MKPTLKHLDPRKLKPNPKNAKRHDQNQIDHLVESIRRYGFTSPVLIDRDGMIIAGHGRTQAAITAGLKTIPAISINLEGDQARAYAIADNKLAELGGGWNLDILRAELADLSTVADIETGFTSAEIDALLHGPQRKLSREEIEQAEPAEEPAERADDFERQLSKITNPTLPIVPMYGETAEAFIIVCDNTVDEAWLRNLLQLEEPRASYKDQKVQSANVITVSALRQKWTSR
jgi:ParB-like chromosome segregation protein Spo0J